MEIHNSTDECADRPLLTVHVSATVLANLQVTVELNPLESVALLFADARGAVCHSVVGGSRATSAGDQPGPGPLERAAEWVRIHLGLELAGLARFQPPGTRGPSAADRRWANRVMSERRTRCLHLPVVQVDPGGRACQLTWWMAEPTTGPPPTPARVRPATVTTRASTDQAWLARVAEAADMRRLATSRVVASGVGGARSALEDLARSGVSQFVLIDPDRIEAANIATQHVHRDELGLPKVVAAAAGIRRINPDALVVPIQREVEQVLDGGLLSTTLLHRPLGGSAVERTVLGAWTDRHEPNAYVARVGLSEGIPVVFTDLYAGASAGAVFFVDPERSVACHRCWVPGRYDHHETGGNNTATSYGAQAWATTRLNSLKVRMVLALLQVGTSSPAGQEAARLLRRLARTPVGLVRLAVDAADRTRIDSFDRFRQSIDPVYRDAIVADDTIWLPVLPKAGCRQCGGTGHLSIRRPASGRADQRSA